MANKIGASHVDWVISMGVFIIYIVALFVFLRPGVQVEHKPQALLDLLEERIKSEIYVNLKETPLYVKECDIVTSGDPPVQITPEIIVEDENNNWKFVRGIGFNGLGSSTISLSCDTDKSGDYILDYLPKEKTSGKPSLNAECKCGGSVCDETKCKIELRATENRFYVYELYTDELGEKIYNNDFKTELGFPPEKEFVIKTKKDNEDEIILIGSEDKKPEQANVYIIEWKDNYITENYGSSGDIIIHIEIW